MPCWCLVGLVISFCLVVPILLLPSEGENPGLQLHSPAREGSSAHLQLRLCDPEKGPKPTPSWVLGLRVCACCPPGPPAAQAHARAGLQEETHPILHLVTVPAPSAPWSLSQVSWGPRQLRLHQPRGRGAAQAWASLSVPSPGPAAIPLLPLAFGWSWQSIHAMPGADPRAVPVYPPPRDCEPPEGKGSIGRGGLGSRPGHLEDT